MCQQFNKPLLLCFSHVDKDWGRGSVKPIFHCDAKTLTLGRRFGQYNECKSFALRIQTCWSLKTLKFALPPTRTLNFRYPQCEPLMQRVGHVDFMLFGTLSLALGSQREYNFQWNMGLRVI